MGDSCFDSRCRHYGGISIPGHPPSGKGCARRRDGFVRCSGFRTRREGFSCDDRWRYSMCQRSPPRGEDQGDIRSRRFYGNDPRHRCDAGFSYWFSKSHDLLHGLPQHASLCRDKRYFDASLCLRPFRDQPDHQKYFTKWSSRACRHGEKRFGCSSFDAAPHHSFNPRNN